MCAYVTYEGWVPRVVFAHFMLTSVWPGTLNFFILRNHKKTTTSNISNLDNLGVGLCFIWFSLHGGRYIRMIVLRSVFPKRQTKRSF